MKLNYHFKPRVGCLLLLFTLGLNKASRAAHATEALAHAAKASKPARPDTMARLRQLFTSSEKGATACKQEQQATRAAALAAEEGKVGRAALRQTRCKAFKKGTSHAANQVKFYDTKGQVNLQVA